MTDILCKRCGNMCEFDPEEHGYMTWCDKCNDYPEADIDAAYIDYFTSEIDHARDIRKENEHILTQAKIETERRVL